MNSQIDFRTLPNNVPSLCIPRVFTNWTENRIRRIFDDLGMGEIQRIDVISKTTEKGEKFNRVFVHFKRWFSNQNADMARERLLNGKEIKIVYDDPWFWKVSAYREANKKSDHHLDREERPRASIKFDDDREQAKGRPNERDRRRDDSRDRNRPLAPSLTKSSRSYEHDHRRHQDDSRDRRREKDSKPRNDNSKEALDRELEKINPTIPESMRVEKTSVQDEVGAGGVVYDMAVVSSAKRRKILIKKHTTVQKPPLKIEAEEGELSDGDQPVGDGADGDGLANVRW
jgi:hypothetical protein